MPAHRTMAPVLLVSVLAGACASLAGVEDGELARDAGASGTSGGDGGGGAGGGASGGAAGNGVSGAGGSATGGTSGAGTGGASGSSAGGSGGSGATGSKYAEAVLADNPLAYWRLNETSGTVAVDATGNQNDGLLKGGVKLGEPGALSESDPAMYFDGTSFIDVGDKLDLAGGQSFTIEAWVWPQAGKGGYFGKAMYDQGYKGYFLADNDTTLQFVRDGAVVAVTVVPYTQYTHIVGTFDGLNLILYLNGAKAGSKVATNPVTDHPNPLTIGQVNGWGDFVGWIDEVSIYDTAISEARVKAHYDAGKGQ